MNFDIILLALIIIFAHAIPRVARAAQGAAHERRSPLGSKGMLQRIMNLLHDKTFPIFHDLF